MSTTDATALRGHKKGGGSTATEAPDSLRSVQTAQVVDLISEGPIKGLVNGLRSVYFDGVPIENADGSRNFEKVTFGLELGTQGQPPLEGIDTVQNERGVGVEVTYVTPVTQTILNASVDTVRLTIAVPQLTKLDTSSGNLGGSEFTYAIDIQSAGGGFVEVHRETISGKSTDNYKRATRLKLPGEAPWDIRVRRITADSTSSALVNAFRWESFTEIQSVQLRYPNSAVAGIQISARQFSRVPARAYDVLGLCVRVPVNYDPIAGTYEGVWNGDFKIAWTNNPAWVYYDLATHPRYGAGRYLSDHHLDKWSLYEIGRYCDVRVPDGQGGTEPRFTCNLYLQTDVQARQALQDLAGLFRAITYWGGGSVSVLQDAPADAKFLFTPANVIGGRFAYESVSRKTRHSTWTVYYNDLAQLGRRSPAVYIDPDLVRQLGMVPETFSPIGCTSRGQAMRLARWAAFSEAMGRTVSFRAGPDCASLWPGQIFKVADPRKAGKRLGGRVREASVNEVTLDAPVTLEPGQGYKLEVMLPDASQQLGYKTELREVTTPAGEHQTLAVSPPFSDAPRNAAVWVLQPANIQPTWWRMLARKDVDGTNEYDVLAIQHDPEKFAAIEQGLKLAPKPTSGLSVVSPQVASISLTETPYMDGAMPRIRVTVSWPEPAAGLRYRVTWRLSNGPWTSLPQTSANAVDLDGLQPGLLEVSVQTINSLGRESAPLMESLVLAGKVVPPADVEGLVVAMSPAGWTLAWSEPPDADWSASEVRRGGADFTNGFLSFFGRALQASLGWLPAGANTMRVVHWAGARRSATPTPTVITIQAPAAATITDVKQSIYSCVIEFADATTSQPLRAVHLRAGSLADTWESAPELPSVAGGARSSNVVLPKGNRRLFTRAEDAYGNLGPVDHHDVVVVGFSATEILDELGGSLTEDLLSLELRNKIDGIDQLAAAVSEEIDVRTDLTDGLRAQYTLKAQVTRPDGTVVFGGIGLAAESNGEISQSHLLLMADRLTFVPSGDLNANPVPLLTTQLVGGQQTVILRAALIGSLSVTNEMLAGDIRAEKIDARGLSLKDAAGNVILAAGSALAYSNISASPNWLNSNIGINSSGELYGAGAGNGVKVSNNQLSMGSNGVLYNGGSAQGQVTTMPVVDGDRDTNRPPSWYPVGTIREFKRCTAIGLGEEYGFWCTLETIKQYAHSQTGYPGYQYAYVGAATWRRRSVDDAGSAWTAWTRDISEDTQSAGVNLLRNPGFDGGWTSWAYDGGYGIGPADSGFNLGGFWHPSGGHALWSRQAGTANNSAFYYRYRSDGVPVEGGKRYILSAYTGAHRCRVATFLQVFDAAGNMLLDGAAWGQNAAEMAGGQALSGYKRQFGIVDMPTNAAWARAMLDKSDTYSGFGDSYMFVARVALEIVGANATTPGPWSDSGFLDVTTVRAQNPITPANSAALVVNGAIRANHLSVDTLSSVTTWTGTLTVSDWGYVRGGQYDYDAGTGFFLGSSGGQYKFSIGRPNGPKMTWDGSSLSFSAGSIMIGVAGSATGFYDPAQPTIRLKSSAVGSMYHDARVYGFQSIVSSSAVTFKNGDAGWPEALRIRTGQLTFLVNATGVVEQLFSLWVRKNGGGWSCLRAVTEPGSGLGASVITYQLNDNIVGGDVFEFGIANTDAYGNQFGNNDWAALFNAQLTVTVINF